jgi:ribosomal protein L40E
MSYIVCPNCKRYFKVDDTQPLNFDKCLHCNNTLEYAGSDAELRMILRGIVVPQVSSTKICADCNSLNPRETGACLHCGSSNLYLQYDMDSISSSPFMQDLNDSDTVTKTIIIQPKNVFSPKKSWIFRLFSLLIGLIDFFFFSLLGVQLILGSSDLPSDIMAFATQNLNQLMIVVCVALVLSGIMSVMIIPKMSYRDSLETSSTIGVVVGLVTLIATKDILTVIISIVFCSILAGIGGLIGEFIIHKLTRRS